MSRTLLAPLLLGFLVVPSCFYVLPAQEALDRWFFATGFGFFIAIGLAIVTGIRGARVRTSFVVLLSTMGGAVIAHVALAGLAPIHDRRYCEAHQLYVHQTLQKAAATYEAAKSCLPNSAGIEAAFAGSRAEHFTFRVVLEDDRCVFSAIGEDYQAGCDTVLTVQPDGKRDVERSLSCADKCE